MSWFIHLNFKHKLYNIEKLYLPPSILSVVNHKINRMIYDSVHFCSPSWNWRCSCYHGPPWNMWVDFLKLCFVYMKKRKEWKITGQTNLTPVIMQEILFFSPLHNVGIVTVRPTFQVTNSKHVHILFLCFYISLD